MNIHEAQLEAYDIAKEKGFHEPMDSERAEVLARLALIHTEVSEATQIVKRHFTSGFESSKYVNAFGEELADAIIRMMDLAERVDVDLNERIAIKMRANATRPYLYGTPQEVHTIEENTLMSTKFPKVQYDIKKSIDGCNEFIRDFDPAKQLNGEHYNADNPD